MTNKRAQALIEFVLILPVLIILLFSIIDFGNIFIVKNELEGNMDLIYDVFRSSADIETLNSGINTVKGKMDSKTNVSVVFDDEKEYAKVTLKKDIKTITPGLNLILGYPYKVKIERVIKYVKQ